ncbi:hypothetical protein ACD591_12825 [Rufibacter glacialis]|uniref:Uncharacterized protein n=1 Tax=Rufibacter glacialis TaxID=1259555 RepID=A0A5M8QQ78_9BACT|nr:hypothetical protein [Rufibacter glacialis]KAA6437154.1 hypothetical protein FOE74_01250 [Rufibacter glacialis]GGK61702.1 hypothetical protein GCM10011405_07200 [Rufibacter glacialis]
MLTSVWKRLISGKSKRKLDFVGVAKKDYFDRVNYVRTVVGLRNVLSKPKQVAPNTAREVAFRGLPFGASLKEAKRLLGKPEFQVNHNQDVVGHEVLFYFSPIGSMKVTQCLHFLHGKFIMGQSHIKTTKPAKGRAVLEAELANYGLLPEPGVASLEGLFPICDGQGNRVEMHHAFDLTLTYVTGDPAVLPLVAKAPQVKEKSKKSFLKRILPVPQVRYV